MIKIISGYTNPGGSTIALLNLTNELNKSGYPTILYGRESWIANKCRSEPIQDLKITPEDYLISHFLKLPERPKCAKVVLSCHEKWWFKVSEIYRYWDVVVFLNHGHVDFHKYSGEYEIIPNIRESLKKQYLDDPRVIDNLNVAGIIGAIEDRKKTHISIQRALADGCEKVLLFGLIQDQKYFEEMVKPLLNNRVEFRGFVDDKQLIYDQIGKVYHSSIGECASLVKDECETVGIEFHGCVETENEKVLMSNEEIIQKWIGVLEL
jgi:hypothetical protein